jgi:hypothetical protein
MTTPTTSPSLRRSAAVLLFLLGTAGALAGCDRRTPTTDPAAGGTGTGSTSTAPMPPASAASR